MRVDLSTVENNQDFVGATELVGVFNNRFLDIDLSGSKLSEVGDGFRASKIKSIDLGDTNVVTKYAFFGCSDLKSVNLPAGVTLLDACFSQSGLEKVEVCDGSIGVFAFRECLALTQASLIASTEYGKAIFLGCTALTSVHIVDCQLGISDRMFEKTGLTSIDFIPQTVKHIGKKAFFGCSLDRLNLANFDFVGRQAFGDGNKPITNLTFDSSKTVFERYALFGTSISCVVRATSADVNVLSGADMDMMIYTCHPDDDSIEEGIGLSHCYIETLKLVGERCSSQAFQEENKIGTLDASEIDEIQFDAFDSCEITSFITRNPIKLGAGALCTLKMESFIAPLYTLTQNSEFNLKYLEVFRIICLPDEPTDFAKINTIKLHSGYDVPYNIAELCYNLEFGEDVQHVTTTHTKENIPVVRSSLEDTQPVVLRFLETISGPNVQSIVTTLNNNKTGPFQGVKTLRTINCPKLRELGRNCFSDCVNLDCSNFIEHLQVLGENSLQRTKCSKEDVHISPHLLGIKCLSEITFLNLTIELQRYWGPTTQHDDGSVETGLTGMIVTNILKITGDVQSILIGYISAKELDLRQLGELKTLGPCALSHANVSMLLLPQQSLFIGEYALANSDITCFSRPRDTLGEYCLTRCYNLRFVDVTLQVNVDTGLDTCQAVKILKLHGKVVPPALCWYWKELKFVELDIGVRTIGAAAFRNSSVGVIDAPGVVEIKARAFENTPLYEFKFSSVINKIGVDAFANCEQLERVVFPKTGGVITITRHGQGGLFVDPTTPDAIARFKEAPLFRGSHKLKCVFVPHGAKFVDDGGVEMGNVFNSEQTQPVVSSTDRITGWGPLLQTFTRSAFIDGELSVFDVKGLYSHKMVLARKHVVDMLRVVCKSSIGSLNKPIGVLPIEIEDMIFAFLGIHEIKRLGECGLTPLRPGYAILTNEMRMKKTDPEKNQSNPHSPYPPIESHRRLKQLQSKRAKST